MVAPSRQELVSYGMDIAAQLAAQFDQLRKEMESKKGVRSTPIPSRSNHAQSGTAPDHCDRDDNNAREQVISAAELDGLLGAGPQPGSIEARLLLLPPSRSSTPAAK